MIALEKVCILKFITRLWKLQASFIQNSCKLTTNQNMPLTFFKLGTEYLQYLRSNSLYMEVHKGPSPAPTVIRYFRHTVLHSPLSNTIRSRFFWKRSSNMSDYAFCRYEYNSPFYLDMTQTPCSLLLIGSNGGVFTNLVELLPILIALFLYLMSRIWYLRCYLELLNYVLILDFFIKIYWTLTTFLKEMIILVTLLTFVWDDIWTKFSKIKRYMPLHLKKI